MPTEPPPLTLSALVRRACAIVDPADEDAVVAEFEERFEDADEPVTGVDGLEVCVPVAVRVPGCRGGRVLAHALAPSLLAATRSPCSSGVPWVARLTVARRR